MTRLLTPGARPRKPSSAPGAARPKCTGHLTVELVPELALGRELPVRLLDGLLEPEPLPRRSARHAAIAVRLDRLREEVARTGPAVLASLANAALDLADEVRRRRQL